MTWCSGTVGLDLAVFRGTSTSRVMFSGCRLTQADFADADLTGVTFEDCDLTGVQFSGAKMAGARLRNCVLAGVNGVESMRGAHVSSHDLAALAWSLAGALGITVTEDG